MAAPTLRQSTSNAVASGQARSVTATLTEPTVQGNLIVVIAISSGGSAAVLTGPTGFTLIRDRSVGNLRIAVWYREGAPPTSSFVVTINMDRSLQVRVMEYAGAAQSGALDRVTVLTNTSQQPVTGTSGATAQADEIIVACIGNRYASTTQSGFSGGLTRLFEQVSPQYWGFFATDADENRTRLTVHQLVSATIGSFSLSALLSSVRDWIAVLCTFKGGSSGPKRFSSTLASPALQISGSGGLTAFGPLKSTGAAPALTVTGSANIGPFVYQYLLNGLLIGQGTSYEVISHEGLEGWDIRTSDDDQPRGDGALRGIDLQSARQLVFEVEVLGSQTEVETRIDALYRALVPQRDEDWDLVWRHPGRPLRMLRCRPTQLTRELDWARSILTSQPIALRAADPRHYSAVLHRTEIPVTPAGAATPTTIAVTNTGNIAAHPLITVTGPTSGPQVTRVSLVNVTTDVAFDVATVIPARATLIGDMEARATGAPRSAITLDGQSKYGSWQLPRTPFRIDADPVAPGGVNTLYLETVPAGAPISCVLAYRDTWAG